ncbi:MAG: biotin--[acetyl-CoA-carboxylase] ligase [Myxococcaceae bacterium]|nr:biotin--[acetyl-CoA-carboxylase] ligase [Myxococcaceae bacterium]
MILAFLADGGDEFTSGAALSDKLGLSRTAVWKHVEALRKMGYGIEAVPSRGYRLVEVPDRLTALELTPLLATHDVGRVIHFAESMASTNATAFTLANEGAFHGETVVAEAQTQGRGRRGRSWVSPAGKNLYCSVILRPELPPARASELTLVAAVALAETVTEAGAPAKIKWPNDVQLEGKKVAGILTELSAEAERVHFVVVGVGVNLNMGRADFPDDLRESATALSMVRGQRVPRALFTAAFLTRFEQWLDRHAEEGFAPVREAWKKHSSTLGQEVLVKTEAMELKGTAIDIDDAGALLVKTAEGKVERVLAGDVEQVRPKR